MTFTPPPHTPYQWQDAPSRGTPLDAAHLEAAETDLVGYTQSALASYDSFAESRFLSGSIVDAGNLGATYTLDLGGQVNQATTLRGTLNANCTITIANRAAGCRVVILIVQDATGSRTLNISDGTSSTPIAVTSSPLTLTTIEIDCPNTTDVYVSPLGSGGLPSSVATVSSDAIRYVSANTGSDSNNGKSLGTAHATIAHAVNDLPNGGTIYLAPGNYVPANTIVLNGHRISGMGPMNANTTTATAIVQHTFNGDMFQFATGSLSGGIDNLYLRQATTGLTGAAISCTSSAAQATGYFNFRNLIFSGVTGGWERNMILDGSANSIGVRSVWVENCDFFGCFTPGENVLVNRGVHIYFTACDIVQAPATQQQGFKIIDAFSEDIQYLGKVLGDWNTQAGGNGVWFFGRITGAITCQASSQNNVFYGQFDSGATFTNNGDAATNIVQGKPLIQAASSLLQNSWTDTSGNDSSGYSLDMNRTVRLQGRISGGTATVNTTLFTLPTAFRPSTTHNFLVFALKASGTLQPSWITINSGGVVALQTDLSGTGTPTISLDGISFTANS